MKSALTTALALVTLTGCSYGSNELTISGPIEQPAVDTPAENLPVDNTPPDGTPVNRCDVGRKYVGIGGLELTEDRPDLDIGVDRSRVKPFTALPAEYARVLGNTPALLTGMGPTFGEPPARWSAEAQVNAVSLYTSYRIAFQGCLTYTASGTKWSVVPNTNTAETECIAFAEKFWSRSPSADELSTCTNVALNDSSTETDPRRRWAYSCAAVLTSAGFLTY